MINTITEIKNSQEGINNKIDDTKEWISELKVELVDVTPLSWTENNFLKMRTVWEIGGTISSVLTFTLWGPKRRIREKATENTFEDVTGENFSNLKKKTHTLGPGII